MPTIKGDTIGYCENKLQRYMLNYFFLLVYKILQAHSRMIANRSFDHETNVSAKRGLSFHMHVGHFLETNPTKRIDSSAFDLRKGYFSVE